MGTGSAKALHSDLGQRWSEGAERRGGVVRDGSCMGMVQGLGATVKTYGQPWVASGEKKGTVRHLWGHGVTMAAPLALVCSRVVAQPAGTGTWRAFLHIFTSPVVKEARVLNSGYL